MRRSTLALAIVAGVLLLLGPASAGYAHDERETVAPDGSGVVWWYDEIGNERGRWMVSPFEGGDARPLFRGLHDSWMMGVSVIDGGAAAGLRCGEAFRSCDG